MFLLLDGMLKTGQIVLLVVVLVAQNLQYLNVENEALPTLQSRMIYVSSLQNLLKPFHAIGEIVVLMQLVLGGLRYDYYYFYH